MKRHGAWFALSLALLPVCAFAADDQARGIQPGSVIGFGGAGLGHDSGSAGIHPSFGGGIVLGLTGHLGVFAEGDYTRIPTPQSSVDFPGVGSLCFCGGVKPGLMNLAGGGEVVGTNHSRFVPYAKLGPGYGHAPHGFGSQSFADDAPGDHPRRRSSRLHQSAFWNRSAGLSSAVRWRPRRGHHGHFDVRTFCPNQVSTVPADIF